MTRISNTPTNTPTDTDQSCPWYKIEVGTRFANTVLYFLYFILIVFIVLTIIALYHYVNTVNQYISLAYHYIGDDIPLPKRTKITLDYLFIVNGMIVMGIISVSLLTFSSVHVSNSEMYVHTIFCRRWLFPYPEHTLNVIETNRKQLSYAFKIYNLVLCSTMLLGVQYLYSIKIQEIIHNSNELIEHIRSSTPISTPSIINDVNHKQTEALILSLWTLVFNIIPYSGITGILTENILVQLNYRLLIQEQHCVRYVTPFHIYILTFILTPIIIVIWFVYLIFYCICFPGYFIVHRQPVTGTNVESSNPYSIRHTQAEVVEPPTYAVYQITQNDGTLTDIPLSNVVWIRINRIVGMKYTTESNLDKPWNWFWISCNPNITWEFIEANSDKPWVWDEISRNPNITWDIIESNPDKPWDWYYISRNPNITPKFIETNLDKPWDWYSLCRNPNLTWEIIKTNPDKPWKWFMISQNPSITLDIITSSLNLSKPRIWTYLSRNPNITPEFIQANLDKPWDWNWISSREFKQSSN